MAKRLIVSLILLLLLGSPSIATVETDQDADPPYARPTFHAIGLYWKPGDGAVDNECQVLYRPVGRWQWRTAMPLWFDDNAYFSLQEHSHEYRGSIVNLEPGITYEIKLRLQATGTEAKLKVTTWSEDFKITSTILLPAGESQQPLSITQGGSAERGYVLYTSPPGQSTIIDVGEQHEAGIEIDASYVILRGVTVKGGRKHGIVLGNVHNVVIEACDISGWGTTNHNGFGENFNSAIYSTSNVLERIVVQRCKLHHPRSDANSWEEGGHPEGPQAITFVGSKGHHVIRYNEIYSDEEHVFNDGMGEHHNFSYQGFPNRDSDIYGNRISHCWDDAIESEGAGMNVRIWGNYIDTTYMAFGLATTSLGPHYVWRNISGFSRRGPSPLAKHDRGGAFAKLGTAEQTYTKGKLYLLHNTILQPLLPWDANKHGGSESGLLVTDAKYHQENITSRNNILYVRSHSGRSIYDPQRYASNSFDYDLFNGVVFAVEGSETHGIKLQNGADPEYNPNNKVGEFALSPDSPGYDAGLILPNFNDGYSGKAPDIGAFEHGYPPMQFGIQADWSKWARVSQQDNLISTNVYFMLISMILVISVVVIIWLRTRSTGGTNASDVKIQ